jgi:hypothetical protein
MSPILQLDQRTEVIRQGAAQKYQRDGQGSLQEKQKEPGNSPGTGGSPDQAESIRDIGQLSFRFAKFFVQREVLVKLEAGLIALEAPKNLIDD